MSFSNEQDRESGWIREARHNPCLMRPISAIAMLILILVSGITMLFFIPSFLLGLLISPLARRTSWFIEFLYPLGLARWGHFLLVKSASSSRKRPGDHNDDINNGHSRTMEQRIEVIKGRVYIHMLPQLLDNLAYLVVCLPPPSPSSHVKTIVAFLVDCGDADEALTQTLSIRDIHYRGYEMDVQSVLCTHKHHDHTAGNIGLLQSELVKVQHIVGGAVERVPHCTTLVANGDMVALPRVDGNDMNDVVQVEVVAMPAHTRGSVLYALSIKNDDDAFGAVFCFAGDTMFSGGGGVPFEADTETRNDQRLSNKNGTSPIKPSAGSRAVERCFAELLHRGSKDTSKMLIFPGHEYTSDLIARQFRSGGGDTSAWNRMPPSVFFETASQYYIASHRRALPHNGKILTVPTVVSRELYINPHFRSLKKRGEHIVRALRIWYRHFCSVKIDDPQSRSASITISPGSAPFSPKPNDSNKTPSTETEWNVTVDDVNRPIFTTLFSADLEAVIEDLTANRIGPERAAKRLKSIQSKLQDNLIRRRPIPGTLPTDKSIYQGVLALAILGSPPCAMTVSDSRTMNLPMPNDYNSDRIRISKTRLLSVLTSLELLTTANDGHKVIQMIDLLWEDAVKYGVDEESAVANGSSNADHSALENGQSNSSPDQVELGVLKWCLYGAQANQPSWFTKFCMLCEGSVPSKPTKQPPHPVQALNARRTNGELVRHDVLRCPLCRDATGCPLVEDISESFTTDDSPRKDLSPSSNGKNEQDVCATSPEAAVEVELPTFSIREESANSLPFDEEDSDAEKIEMQAIIKPMLTEA